MGEPQSNIQKREVGGLSVMQKYTKNYIESLSLTVGDYFPCEGCPASTVDVHHITPRGLGGSHEPENLVGLCRDCHDKADASILTRDYLYAKVRKRMGDKYREGYHLRKYAKGGG